MLKKITSHLGSSIQRLLTTTPPAAVAAPAAAEVGLPAGRREAPRRRDDPESRAQRRQRLQLRLMRRDLHVLMEQHADSRRMMAHLGLVERVLRKEGLAAVEALPRPVLDKALLQLESLVQDWSPVGLADLRSRLAVMLRDRAAAQDRDRRSGTDTDDDRAELGEGLIVTIDLQDVSETDHAAFAEMERSWLGRQAPGPSAERETPGNG